MSDLHRQALESVNFGILVFDRRGRLAYANPAAEEILQESAQSLSGRHYRTLFRGSPGVARLVRRALQEQLVLTGFDVPLRPAGAAPARRRDGADGSPAFIVGVSPFAGASGEPDGVALSLKPAEILSIVGREEQAALSADEMQMLAYGIAHEIKNPLGGIRGAAQWILRAGATGEERREGAALILRESGRINTLVEKMLEMSRPPPPARPFSVLPLLKEAEQLVAAELRGRKKTVRFEQRLDPSLPDVSGHPDTIFRAILNVVKNAAEAIEREGAVRIDAHINVDYRWSHARGRRRSFVEIAVSDDGPGMSPAEARKALLPFFTTKPGGTGLGLVMARQAVTRHGGKLDIESVRGKGTTVTISLPVDPGKKRWPCPGKS